MRIAVLMATYNGERFLEEQIDSILNQQVDGKVDLIVCDDGSTDNTEKILARYAAQGKLSYTVHENTGAAGTFLGLLKATPGYDYYAFSDQDDVWFPQKLKRGIDAVKNTAGIVLYCSNCELVDQNLERIGRNTHRAAPTYSLVSVLCLASCAQGCTSVFNRELAELVQQYPLPDPVIMHDSMLTCLCALTDGKILYDHEPSMLYRMHQGNVFGMASAKQSIIGVLRDRFREITTKRKIGMSDQTEAIQRVFNDRISDEKQEVCRRVIRAKHSLGARIRLVTDPQLKHDTYNKTLTKKLTILFGND
ncbi:MAG: glycosyltransferase family 2 protein [Clostridia bacterium]|nr:glycosyltransferase family 2 protein [Clostridia bacterium]